MMTRTRLGFLLLVLAAAAPYALRAQPAEQPADDAAERRSPLPTYFGKIAVSDEQRVKLYQIQDDYGAKVDALQRQIKDLLKERDVRMEALLTPGQKLRLQELRAEAERRAAEKAQALQDKSPVPPASGN